MKSIVSPTAIPDGARAKAMALAAVELHRAVGASTVTADVNNALIVAAQFGTRVLLLGAEEDLAVVRGRSVSVKQVRGFLWQHRKDRKARRANMVLWTSYDEKADQTLIGFGALVRPEVAERYGRMVAAGRLLEV